MSGKRVKFTQILGGLAKVEGSAKLVGSGVELEMTMTESITGPVKGVLKRSLKFTELEDVKYSKRFLKPPVLQFRAVNLDVFSKVPGASGFEYSVNPENTKLECMSFVTDAQLAIAEAIFNRFTEQLGDSGRPKSV